MNAIILAAGMGTRLRPLTNDIPKCLVKVNGIPMVERQIQFLKEKGIQDITLVTGYQSEKLNYLIDKYNVQLVENKLYDQYNNIYSLYLVLDRFSDTYILEGDIWLAKNCLQKQFTYSSYLSAWKTAYVNEWGLNVDEDLRLKSVSIGDGEGYLMCGISYWKKEDCQLIAEALLKKIASGDFKDLYWDNIVLEVMDQLHIRVVPVNDIYEIDTVQDLQDVERMCDGK